MEKDVYKVLYPTHMMEGSCCAGLHDGYSHIEVSIVFIPLAYMCMHPVHIRILSSPVVSSSSAATDMECADRLTASCTSLAHVFMALYSLSINGIGTDLPLIR